MITTVAVLGASAGGYYFYRQYTSTKDQLQLLQTKNANSDEQESQHIIASVAKLVDIPSDKPTVATITDKDKLKNQAFFASAENGDKILIFASTKKAIIYRPSTNKIVDIAPININTASASAQPTGKVAGAATTATPTPTQKPVSIVLLNGTATSGLTNNIEPSVKKAVPNASITKEAAQKSDYDKSIIVVSKSEAKSVADKLSSELNIPIGDSPYGEDLAGKADIVILLGNDKK